METNNAEKTRYSDEELEEFKEIILKKLERAQADFDLYKSMLTKEDMNDIDDTSPTFKVLEEGQNVLSKEEIGRIARHMQYGSRHLI